MGNRWRKMGRGIPDIFLEQLSEFISERLGLHFTENRRSDLERGIKSAADELGFSDTVSFIRNLIKSSQLSREQFETLSSHLTVGETYFFREKSALNALEEHVLPGLINARRDKERRLRILSAGCSTGEEPYTLAIMLSRLIRDIKDWEVDVLASDINPRALEKAAKGIYGQWSFRNAPDWLKDGYFKKLRDGKYELHPEIRKRVTFFHLNLIEDVFPELLKNSGAMDVILCRNVLIYFSAQGRRKAINNFWRALSNDGWLVVGQTELSEVWSPEFRARSFADAMLYQKQKEPQRWGTWKAEIRTGAEPEKEIVIPLCAVSVSPCLPGAAAREADAQALFEQGRYEEAEKRLVEILSNPPESAEANMLLSRIYANQGRHEKALGYCDKALASDSLNPVYHYFYATVLQELGQLKEAENELKRAIYLDPDFILAYFIMGNLMLGQGNYSDAERHFENTLSLLRSCSPEEVIPESEGITAGRLMEMTETMRIRNE
ncbi:MAG: tetratricopeptide repeat protein [Nitrospirae bacterium]|nr:tetratricopeptide repeat protein [Nitrospirota bacterium]